jgi:hypothetical protein
MMQFAAKSAAKDGNFASLAALDEMLIYCF